MFGYFLGQLLYDDTLVLRQSPSTAVHVEDISHLIEHLVIAVHPVKVLSSDVDLCAAGGYQTPAEFLLCRKFLQPREVLAEGVDCSLEDGHKVGACVRIDILKYFELWDDLLLEHTKNELLKVVTFFGNGALTKCRKKATFKVKVHTNVHIHDMHIQLFIRT